MSGEPHPDPPDFMDEEGDAMAVGVGLGHGFLRLDPRAHKFRYTEANPYYYYPAYVVGYVLKVGVVVALALVGAGKL